MLKISPDAKPITRRFFEALDVLKSRREIFGVSGFAQRYGLSHGNLYVIRNHENGTVKVEYLMYLVRDYGISAQWLLTGEGDMFRQKPAKTEESPSRGI